MLKRLAIYAVCGLAFMVAVGYVAAALDPSPPVLAGIYAVAGVTIGYTGALVWAW